MRKRVLKGNLVKISFLYPERDKEELEDLLMKHGMTMSSFVRICIQEGMKKLKERERNEGR
ncbi:MAG: hypothetical protein QXL14_03235 [Candidatus Aenigmatarchaeota archaeon]